MSYTNRALQPQKMAKRLEILNLEREEELYYLCSENEGANLHLCICKKNTGFLMTRLRLPFVSEKCRNFTKLRKFTLKCARIYCR